MNDDPGDQDFLKQAASSRASLFSEFAQFLRENKKWWVAPIVIAMLLLGVLVVLAGTGAAPFIYTLF